MEASNALYQTEVEEEDLGRAYMRNVTPTHVPWMGRSALGHHMGHALLLAVMVIKSELVNAILPHQHMEEKIATETSKSHELAN